MTLQALDNPIWHALQTTQAEFAQGHELAKRFPNSIAPFAAMLEPSPAAFDSLARVLEPGGVGAWFTTSTPKIPEAWQTVFSGEISQMICENLQSTPPLEMRALAKQDVPAMLELVSLTKPGPFSERTIELGMFWGVFVDGHLVAMAGERLRMTGFTEVSAVCTHPDYQSRGYAKALVHRVCEGIFARTEMPFLHVKTSNQNAIRTYQALGFKERCKIQLFVLKAP